MNLVVGATALPGTEICSRLCDDGQDVRALVRSNPRRSIRPATARIP